MAYKVRKSGHGSDAAYSLSVPKPIAEQLPEGIQFRPEFTDDGILYRPVEPSETGQQVPEWVTNAKTG